MLTDTLTDGGERGITVSVAPDGTVEVDTTYEPPSAGTNSEEIDGPLAPRPVPDDDGAKCNSSSSALLGYRWFETSPEWRINQGTIPTAEVSVAGGVGAIRDALANVVHQDNACGFGDATTISGTYLGDTNVTAPISYDPDTGESRCMANTTRDGLNEVQFGTRGRLSATSRVRATVCARVNYREGIDQIAEMDMEIARAWPAMYGRPAETAGWTITPTASWCEAGRDYDLEGVVTHEFGHWYGLAHVDDSTQVMSRYTSVACATDKRSLGRGDIVGMRALY